LVILLNDLDESSTDGTRGSISNTCYFETQLRVPPECQMWLFFSYRTELKFVLMILALSKSLIILNIKFPSTVSQNEYAWMHMEFGKFVVMILTFSKSLIILNLRFPSTASLNESYESWWKFPIIFLIPCKKKQCRIICIYTFIPYVRPCLALQHLLGPDLPQKMPSSSLSSAHFFHPSIPRICDVSFQTVFSHLVLGFSHWSCIIKFPIKNHFGDPCIFHFYNVTCPS